MIQPTWDTIVVGGGPAGCSTAISLARKGIKVLLIEAKTYPHDKMCGEFLSPECTPILDELGVLDTVLQNHPASIHQVIFTAPDGQTWEARLPGRAIGISRKTLDAALAEQAQKEGAVVWEATTVDQIEGNFNEGFTLRTRCLDSATEISTRSVVAAYGKRSVLDRSLQRSFVNEQHPYLAFKAHFHAPRIPDRIEMHAFPGGYCGVSEIEDDARVACFLVKEPVFQQFRGRQADAVDCFTQWMMRQNVYLHAWFQTAQRIHERWISISQVAFSTKPVVWRDVIMAGDAAGLIVPLAGNGISMALEGGMLAAKYTSQFLEGNRTAKEMRMGYPLTWHRRFDTRLKLGRLLQPIALNPASLSWLMRFLNKMPWVGNFLVSHTRGSFS